MDAPPETLKALFPLPSAAPRNIRFTPAPLPGLTFDSAQAVLEDLKDNHRKRHIFFNDKHFHKSVHDYFKGFPGTDSDVIARSHASHHLLAIYALGADRKLLHIAYQTHVIYQRPSFPSPGDITEENWKLHLGDDK